MSNITKNLLLALTLVCVIVLIVFCIQLIVINRGVEPAGAGATVSGDSQQGDEDPEDNENDPGEDEGFDPGPAIVTPRPPPQGTRHELRVTENSQLIVYARDELFDFTQDELDWWFTYTGGGTATLEIAFTLISPQGAAAHAETFLNSYTGGSRSEFVGEESIQGSPINGYHVTAQQGGEWYEAWIHTLSDSDLALAFVITYQNEQQRAALHEVLSSMEIQ